MKKGQISAFIILGLVVLLIVSLLLVLQSIGQKQYTESTSTFTAVQFALFPPDQYVQLCTEQELLSMMEIISKNGGVYDSADPNITRYRNLQYYPYETESFLFHYLEDEGQLLVNHNFVSDQIDTYLGPKIKSCINETLYEDQGYEVTSGSITTQTTISQEDIIILVSYPLELIKNDISVKRETFQVRVQYPYGYLLDTVKEIINYELEENSFSQERFMNQYSNVEFNSFLLDIQKYKPYPHVLYNLSVEKEGVRIPFYFAIEGKDVLTGSSIDLASQQAIGKSGGCCQVSGACYKDVNEELCSLAQGLFTQDSSCSCLDEAKNINELEIEPLLNSCDGIPSGYSYCDSLEGVGGRDFRVICQDGEWVTEYCRDFRQEVCVQTDDGDMSYTQCRFNDATSCSQCTTQECCEQKDCQYLPGGACVPKESPGLRFWDIESSNAYCQNAFAALPATTSTTDAQVLCAQLGDCSLKPNYIGEYSYEPTDLFLERQSLLRDYEPLSYSSTLVSNYSYTDQSAYSFSTLLARSLEQLDILINSPLEDFYDPSLDSAEELTYVCQAYNPPVMDQCELCETLGECSEYSCKSLGDSCFYLVDATGNGVCRTVEVTSGELEINNIAVSDKTVSSVYVNGSQGFKVDDSILAGELVDLTFETSQLALCKPTYLPNQLFSQIQSSDLSYGVYTKNHSLQIRFVNDLPVFETLLDRFEVPSYDSLASAFVSFKYRLDQLRLRYPYVQKFQLPLYSQVSHFVDAYLDPLTQDLVSGLLDLLDQKTYGLFLSCVSQTGATNSDTFVLLQLENNCENPVQIESMYGDNGNYTEELFYVTTDMWAECKYDYEDKSYELMNYTMSCSDSLYEVTSDGSYLCEGYVPPLAESVAIKCSQHPLLFAQDYDLNLNITFNSTAPLAQTVELVNMSTNLTLRNETYLTIQTPIPYLCSVNETYLPCTLDSCQMTQDFWNESSSVQMYCTPRDSQKYCSATQPLVQEESTEFVFGEPETFTVTTQVTDVVINIIPSAQVACTVYSAGTVLELETGQYTFLKESYLEKSVRISCTDSYGQTEETMIDYVS